MRVGKLGLAGRVSVAGPVRHRHHRLTKCLAAPKRLVCHLKLEQIGDEFTRRLRVHRPVGDKQSPSASIEEGTAEAGSRLRTGSRACSGVVTLIMLLGSLMPLWGWVALILFGIVIWLLPSNNNSDGRSQ